MLYEPGIARSGRRLGMTGVPVRFSFVLIAAALLTACGSGDASSPRPAPTDATPPGEPAGEDSTSPSPAALSTDTVRLAVVTPFNLASVAVFGRETLGTFDDVGLNVDITVANSQTANLLLETGDVDMVLSSPNRPVADIARGLNAKIIAAESLCWGQVVIARADLGAQSIDDLKGKTFGISGFGSGGHFATLKVAEAFGWSEDDYTVSQLGDRDALVAALRSGAIDVFIWNSLEGQNLESQGIADVLGSVNPYIEATGSVFVVSDSFIQEHADAVVAMMSAFFDMQQKIKDDPSLAREVAIEEFEQDPDATDFVLDEVVECMDPDGAIPPANLQGIADAAILSNEDLDSVDTSDVYVYWRDLQP